MSLLDSLRVAYRPSRPPTAVYPDQHQVERYRREEFRPTASAGEQVLLINLQGGFFSPSALKEMVLPVARAIATGQHGSAVLVVVTDNDSTSEYLEALATRYEVPLYLAKSVAAPLSEARPVGPLTASEAEALSAVRRSGGVITSTGMAEAKGIKVNAALNQLTSLERKKYLYRVSRSRREGDAFVDLLSAVEHLTTSLAAAPEPSYPSEAMASFPEGILSAAAAIAQVEGTDRSSVLARAWSEFVERHHETLARESQIVGDMLREDNREDLAAYAARSAKQRASEAVARLKKTKNGL